MLKAWRVGFSLAAVGVAFVACDSGGDAPPRPAPTTQPTSAPVKPATATTATPSASAAVDETAVKAKIDALLPELRKIATTEAVLSAVKTQNAKKLTQEAIKKIDEEWSKATGVTDLMKPYLENDCATALKKIATPAMVEAFAMDNQGALVCSTSKTSDFWHGDEEKWQKSFAEGKGAEFVDKPKFDESSQTYSIQVSLPVMDEGKAVGALTVGLGLDKL